MGQVTTTWNESRHANISTSTDPKYVGLEGVGKTQEESVEQLQKRINEKDAHGAPMRDAQPQPQTITSSPAKK